MTLTTSTSAPPLSSTSSGTTSIFPTLPTFPSGKTQTTEPLQSPLPYYLGTSLYKSPRDLPLPRSRAASQRQSSHYSGAKEGSIFQGEEGSLRDPSLRSQRSSTRGIETEDRQSVKGQKHSEESMKDIEGRGSQGSIVEERPFITPLQTASPALSNPPTKSTPMEFSTGEAHLPRQSPRSQPRTLPQPTTPITIARALYLLSTGKLVQIPAVLLYATLKDLCNHFQKELLEDPHWAITPAGMDYDHFRKGYILREETLHFACTAYNMIHPDRQIKVPARYQRPQYDTPSTVDTPGPMDDEPPGPLRQAAIPQYPRWEPGYAPAQPSYAYPHGYGPPGSQGLSRLFAAAISGDGAGLSNVPQIPIQPPDKPQPPSGPPPSGPPLPPAGPHRWAPPQYPPPPRTTRSAGPMGS